VVPTIYFYDEGAVVSVGLLRVCTEPLQTHLHWAPGCCCAGLVHTHLHRAQRPAMRTRFKVATDQHAVR
jgi:hypothetical protein